MTWFLLLLFLCVVSIKAKKQREYSEQMVNMIKKVSQSESIIERLRVEGKVKAVDPASFYKSTEELGKKMEEVRREFKQKESDSQKAASIFALTS